jgi:D-arabinose 1-dehydrogenase-like Zn-dependent alcohol dehydrogenase
MTREAIRDLLKDHLLTPQNAALIIIDYQGVDEVTRFVGPGRITIPLERTYPLESTGEALASLKAGRARGKIILTVA